MKVTLVGIGMGDVSTLTIGVRDALRDSDIIIGAARMLDAAEGYLEGNHALRRIEAISPRDIRAALDEVGGAEADISACVVCSGDTGFYSLATTIRSALDGYEVVTLPGITTVQYLAARLGRPWQDCTLVSAHGLSCDILGHVLAHPDVFFLTGGETTARSIVDVLIAAGLDDVEVSVGQRLSYDDESIVCGSVGELSGRDYDPLSSVWVHRGNLRSMDIEGYSCLTSGIPDEAFTRGKTPMTKREVRASVISALNLHPDDVVFDIGAGTGSVSVEAALASPFISVYAIEVDEEALGLIEENRRRFGAYNITLVAGLAPEALEGLPIPDAVFIGGSKGNLAYIIDAVLTSNPAVRIVTSAIALETISEATEAFTSRVESGAMNDFESVQIGVSRGRELGAYHLLTAQNPIMLFSATGTGRKAGE